MDEGFNPHVSMIFGWLRTKSPRYFASPALHNTHAVNRRRPSRGNARSRSRSSAEELETSRKIYLPEAVVNLALNQTFGPFFWGMHQVTHGWSMPIYTNSFSNSCWCREKRHMFNSLWLFFSKATQFYRWLKISNDALPIENADFHGTRMALVGPCHDFDAPATLSSTSR